MKIHNLITALTLSNLYGNGVTPALRTENHFAEELTSHPNLHFFHGSFSISEDFLHQNFPVSYFGTYELQEAVYRDFNRFEINKYLQLTAEFSDSNLVISYYVSESF
ncbi:TPA: hypothetical protein ACGPAJ_000611 [Streptococcus suis]